MRKHGEIDCHDICGEMSREVNRTSWTICFPNITRERKNCAETGLFIFILKIFFIFFFSSYDKKKSDTLWKTRMGRCFVLPCKRCFGRSERISIRATAYQTFTPMELNNYLFN